MKTKCNGTQGVRCSENKSSHGRNINERDCGCFPGKPYFLAHGLGLADSWCEVISRHQDFLITPDISCQSSSYRKKALLVFCISIAQRQRTSCPLYTHFIDEETSTEEEEDLHLGGVLLTAY